MVIVSYEQETLYLRYNFVLQTANEQHRNLSDLRKNFFTGPVLMAKRSQVLGRWKCAALRVRSNHTMTVRETHLGMSFFIVVKVFSKMSPLMSSASWFLATSWILTAPPKLCPYTTILEPFVSSR